MVAASLSVVKEDRDIEIGSLRIPMVIENRKHQRWLTQTIWGILVPTQVLSVVTSAKILAFPLQARHCFSRYRYWCQYPEATSKQTSILFDSFKKKRVNLVSG